MRVLPLVSSRDVYGRGSVSCTGAGSCSAATIGMKQSGVSSVARTVQNWNICAPPPGCGAPPPGTNIRSVAHPSQFPRILAAPCSGHGVLIAASEVLWAADTPAGQQGPADVGTEAMLTEPWQGRACMQSGRGIFTQRGRSQMPHTAQPGQMPARPARAIPRISHDQRQTAASGGIRLPRLQTSQGRQSVPELQLPCGGR